MKDLRGVYQHYKGKLYLVEGRAVNSETREEMILYRELYGDYWLNVRPAAMFFEEVDMPDYNYKGPRFKKVHDIPDEPSTGIIPAK